MLDFSGDGSLSSEGTHDVLVDNVSRHPQVPRSVREVLSVLGDPGVHHAPEEPQYSDEGCRPCECDMGPYL